MFKKKGKEKKAASPSPDKKEDAPPAEPPKVEEAATPASEPPKVDPTPAPAPPAPEPAPPPAKAPEPAPPEPKAAEPRPPEPKPPAEAPAEPKAAEPRPPEPKPPEPTPPVAEKVVEPPPPEPPARSEPVVKEKVVKAPSAPKKHEKEGLCAPLPLGVDVPMFMDRLPVLKAAFKMLDTRSKGVLDAAGARDFLRCAGWLVPDEELDVLLKEVTGPKLDGKHFSFDELHDIVHKNKERPSGNGNMRDLQAAARKLGGSDMKIQAQDIQDLFLMEKDFSCLNAETFLATLGMKPGGELDCDEFVNRILRRIAVPATALEMSSFKRKGGKS